MRAVIGMPLFRRASREQRGPAGDPARVPDTWRTVTANLYDGEVDLEVVGEASYQDALWSICGGRSDERVRLEVIAALVPQPDNPYDSNAISIQVDGRIVGYLSRDDAVTFGPPLEKLMAESGAVVALRGAIVGGGIRSDGLGRLGVFLKYDPADFGLMDDLPAQAPEPWRAKGSMRTGLTEAQLADVADDSYDLGWLDRLPNGDRPAISALRELLRRTEVPIERHFMFAELGSRLYRCRDLYDEALDEFDELCAQHDREMDAICSEFRVRWGVIPTLELYRQMAIRQQKVGDWTASLWWAERGIVLYGDAPARVDAVEDLQKRANRARTKLR